MKAKECRRPSEGNGKASSSIVRKSGCRLTRVRGPLLVEPVRRQRAAAAGAWRKGENVDPVHPLRPVRRLPGPGGLRRHLDEPRPRLTAGQPAPPKGRPGIALSPEIPAIRRPEMPEPASRRPKRPQFAFAGRRCGRRPQKPPETRPAEVFKSWYERCRLSRRGTVRECESDHIHLRLSEAGAGDRRLSMAAAACRRSPC